MWEQWWWLEVPSDTPGRIYTLEETPPTFGGDFPTEIPNRGVQTFDLTAPTEPGEYTVTYTAKSPEGWTYSAPLTVTVIP
jgi:hypothetical protein